MPCMQEAPHVHWEKRANEGIIMAGVQINKKICIIGIVSFCFICGFGWLRLLMITTLYDLCPQQVSLHSLQGFSNHGNHNYVSLKEYYEIVGESRPLSAFSPKHADFFTEMHF